MSEILVAWIGRTDLRAPLEPDAIGLGPIAQAVTSLKFDEAYLLTNYPGSEVQQFICWLQDRTAARLTVLREELSSPTHFGEIYQAAVRACTAAHRDTDEEVRLTFHLSPGTPAMAAVWILLAKTRFPAQLIESSREHGVKTDDVPFEISADFIPDLLKQQDERLRALSGAEPPPAPEFEDIIHRSRIMSRLIQRARRVAVRNVPVLLEGESGTGKEMLARAIHRASSRKDAPFVAVNCGAIPSELVESELFGFEKGAFTGATQSRKGYFEAAHGGTLFLDEIAELPLGAQVKLLRVLQEGEVARVGSPTPHKVDVRVLCATNRLLSEEIAAGRFRDDLFYRLAVATIRIPPLRERPEDLGLLIDSLLRQVQKHLEGEPQAENKTLSVAARKLMAGHPWPGNVRELLNTLHRALLWSEGSIITADDAREALLPTGNHDREVLGRPLGAGFSLPDLLHEVARHYLTRGMEEAGGSKTKAASLLGLPSYQTLTNWLERYRV